LCTTVGILTGGSESITAEDEQAVDRAIELVGCGHLRDSEVGQLSGGQKQLAWIAVVLAKETGVLLPDKWTTFLGLRHQLEVMEIVETLRADSEITLLTVLHDTQQTVRLARWSRLVTVRFMSVARPRGPSQKGTSQMSSRSRLRRT